MISNKTAIFCSPSAQADAQTRNLSITRLSGECETKLYEQLNSRLNFIGPNVPPLFTSLVFDQSDHRLFQEPIKSALAHLGVKSWADLISPG